MKKRLLIVLSVILSLIIKGGAEPVNKRPVEMQFIFNSDVVMSTVYSYDKNGELIKSSQYEQGKLMHYDKYEYDSKGILTQLKMFNPDNNLTRATKFNYDSAGLIVEEQIYSAEEKLIEYSRFSYEKKLIKRIDTYNPDKKLNRFVEFTYSQDKLKEMLYNSIGEYTMTATCIYNEDSLLTGYAIDHSDLRGKTAAEMKVLYLYEEGPVTKRALELIYR